MGQIYYKCTSGKSQRRQSQVHCKIVSGVYLVIMIEWRRLLDQQKDLSNKEFRLSNHSQSEFSRKAPSFFTLWALRYLVGSLQFLMRHLPFGIHGSRITPANLSTYDNSILRSNGFVNRLDSNVVLVLVVTCITPALLGRLATRPCSIPSPTINNKQTLPTFASHRLCRKSIDVANAEHSHATLPSSRVHVHRPFCLRRIPLFSTC